MLGNFYIFGGKNLMDIKKIEKKWQAIWEKDKLNNFNYKNTDKK